MINPCIEIRDIHLTGNNIQREIRKSLYSETRISLLQVGIKREKKKKIEKKKVPACTSEHEILVGNYRFFALQKADTSCFYLLTKTYINFLW